MLIELVFILFGLIWGSFSNALIYRLPNRIPLTNPKRSQCPKCQNDILAKDNIPVVSWLLLKGRCRNCKTPISFLYPLIEIMNAIAAFVSIKFFPDLPTAILVYFLLSILIVITVIDLQHMIIPDKINKPGMIFGILVGLTNQFYQITGFPFSQSLIESAIGLVLGYGILFSIAWLYLKMSGLSGLGGGDIKMMGFIGALLGPYAVFPILISSSFIGVFAGVLIIALKRYSFRSELPFGPSIALGIVLYIFGFDTVGIINDMTESIIANFT